MGHRRKSCLRFVDKKCSFFDQGNVVYNGSVPLETSLTRQQTYLTSVLESFVFSVLGCRNIDQYYSILLIELIYRIKVIKLNAIIFFAFTRMYQLHSFELELVIQIHLITNYYSIIDYFSKLFNYSFIFMDFINLLIFI